MATAVPLTRSGQVLEHTESYGRAYEHHIDYILWNPVKHELTTRIVDWPYSSFHR
jgi:putative transposase